MIMVLVKGDRQRDLSLAKPHRFWFWLKGIGEGISVYPNHTGLWFWLKGIGEGISVYPNHTGFLVLVKGDWRKESQFSLTTQDYGSG
jgi:hypothetical protein